MAPTNKMINVIFFTIFYQKLLFFISIMYIIRHNLMGASSANSAVIDRRYRALIRDWREAGKHHL
jgi:hypothetical protein